MSKDTPHHLAKSIHQRLLNCAREQKEDPNLLFIRYAIERLLYRLSRSPYRDRYILKGAMLFLVWTGQSHRPTRDLDLLGMGDASDEGLIQVFQEIARIAVEADGLVFDSEGISIAEIREAQEYPGKRLKIPAKLGNVVLNLQIDIGFGDAITPEASEVEYPILLDLPAPKIRAYPQETVVAEKLQAMIALDIVTSRMKDFYDLWMMSRSFTFNGVVLTQAIMATFERRNTSIPKTEPTALRTSFAQDTNKQTQWKAFLTRNRFNEISFMKVIEDLRTFLLKPLLAASDQQNFPYVWSPGGPWQR